MSLEVRVMCDEAKCHNVIGEALPHELLSSDWEVNNKVGPCRIEAHVPSGWEVTGDGRWLCPYHARWRPSLSQESRP